jgi:hypothetical protein
MRDFLENLASGAALALLIAAILGWSVIGQALTS